jgi:hypothetical protein
MDTTSFTSVQLASVAGAALIAGVALFQLALAFGAPLGDAVFGGKAPTRDGVLTRPFRVLAVVQAILLLLLGWVFLARAGTVAMPLLGDDTLVWLTWVVVAFLVLNTAANFSAPHPVERWAMGSVTLVLVVLGSFIALRG